MKTGLNVNRVIAESFLKLVTANRIREAYEQYIGQGFRHHNPYFKSDANSLMTGMEENAGVHPTKIFDIQRSIEADEFVAVHSRLRMSENGTSIAVVHIFRFENHRIIELWDIGQPQPEEMVNEIGMF